MVEAKIKKIFCAHYHRRSRGKYKGLEVVVSAALGTCIRTKPVPDEIDNKSLDAFNFKLSFEGFGSTETDEKLSGLHVVSVTMENITERWMNIEDMRNKINQSEKWCRAISPSSPKRRGSIVESDPFPYKEFETYV